MTSILSRRSPTQAAIGMAISEVLARQPIARACHLDQQMPLLSGADLRLRQNDTLDSRLLYDMHNFFHGHCPHFSFTLPGFKAA